MIPSPPSHSSPPSHTSHPSLPKGWRWVKLGEVCDVVTGNTPPRGEARFYGGRIPWVKPEDLDREMYVQETAEYVSEEGCSVARLLPAGSVLVSCIGKIGKTAISGCDLTTNQQINALVPHQEIDSVFLYYSCQFIRSALQVGASQALVPILNKSNFASFEIQLPPLPEQRRIASILQEQMAAVEKARAAAEAQLQAAQALPAAYLREVFPAAGKRLPKGWRCVRLSGVCEHIDYGYTASADFSIDGPRFLRITDIQNDSVIWDAVPGCRIDAKEEEANLLRDGDIVFARTGGTTGKSFLVRKPPRAVFASYLIRLTPKKDADPEFLSSFFHSDLYWSQVRASSRGGAQPNVNASLLGALLLPFPPLSEQQRISGIHRRKMEKVQEAIRAAEFQLSSINALPSALLRLAFSGEL